MRSRWQHLLPQSLILPSIKTRVVFSISHQSRLQSPFSGLHLSNENQASPSLKEKHYMPFLSLWQHIKQIPGLQDCVSVSLDLHHSQVQDPIVKYFIPSHLRIFHPVCGKSNGGNYISLLLSYLKDLQIVLWLTWMFVFGWTEASDRVVRQTNLFVSESWILIGWPGGCRWLIGRSVLMKDALQLRDLCRDHLYLSQPYVEN